MDVQPLSLPGPKLVKPVVFHDSRGSFSESWNEGRFRQKVADVGFVQDNVSWSAKRGTVRGLHAQRPPHAQGKLVHVSRGSIIDVFVDIRGGSPDYGRYGSTMLSR